MKTEIKSIHWNRTGSERWKRSTEEQPKVVIQYSLSSKFIYGSNKTPELSAVVSYLVELGIFRGL